MFAYYSLFFKKKRRMSQTYRYRVDDAADIQMGRFEEGAFNFNLWELFKAALIGLGVAIGIVCLVLLAILVNSERKNDTLKLAEVAGPCAGSNSGNRNPGNLACEGGCCHSSDAVIQAKKAFFDSITLYIEPGWALESSGYQWDSFQSGVQVLRFAQSEQDLEANPAYVFVRDALAKHQAVLNSGKATDIEAAHVRANMVELTRWLELTKLNWLQASYTYNYPPYYDELIFAFSLSAYASEPDYDDRVITYIRRLEAEIPLRHQYYQDVLASSNTPPHVESTPACQLIEFFASIMAIPGLRNDMCNVMTSASLKTECLGLAQNLDSSYAALYQYLSGTYCPAVDVIRPPSQPGMYHLHQGIEAFEVLLHYHSGLADGIDAQYQFAKQYAINEYAQLPGVAPFGLTVEEWLAARTNISDERFFECIDSAQATRYGREMLGNVGAAMLDVFGYLDRSSIEVVMQNAVDSFYYIPGGYNSATGMWEVPGTMTWGHLGSRPGPNGTTLWCMPALVDSVAMHEMAGHHLQLSLAKQIWCSPTTVSYPVGSYTEGFGVHASLLCPETRLCESQVEYAENKLFNGFNLARGSAIDILLNGMNGSLADCTNPPGIPGVPTRPGFCSRVLQMPGQSLTYFRGATIITDLRTQAESALGQLFSLREFNAVISKFGTLTIPDLVQLVTTWMTWKTDRNAALSMPWGKTVDENLYNSCDPVAAVAATVGGEPKGLSNAAVARSNAETAKQTHPHLAQAVSQLRGRFNL